ncbi:Gfo/Idh/MocA family oxidoreductase [Parasalinivibrio latis]|uniref:Gfo/Idh/MocA family protein n=1 Tax=Parasalinivibrio latis TaxID=2952610 RepID=UPI0030E2649B
MDKLNIAVVGAGLIGKSHIHLLSDNPDSQLAAIVEPSQSGFQIAQDLGVPWYLSLDDMLKTFSPDGVILATPNHLHVEQAIQCINSGIPALIEKPVAHSVSEGKRLNDLLVKSDVPLLVGHHRMHSPIISKAKDVIQSGSLGDLVAISGSALFYKPDDYFVAGSWRTQPGGGPILINMIHDVGNLRYLCGEITAVQAMSSNARRGFDVEDTVAMVFAFANGALGTFTLSDTAGSAQSWEQTSQENKAYSTYEDEDCYHIAGTNGSLSVPTFRLKRFANPEERSWWKPFESSVLDFERGDPLLAQLFHFCQVIRGDARPLVSVWDGLQNLRVTDAIVKAVSTGRTVKIDEIL